MTATAAHYLRVYGGGLRSGCDGRRQARDSLPCPFSRPSYQLGTARCAGQRASPRTLQLASSMPPDSTAEACAPARAHCKPFVTFPDPWPLQFRRVIEEAEDVLLDIELFFFRKGFPNIRIPNEVSVLHSAAATSTGRLWFERVRPAAPLPVCVCGQRGGGCIGRQRYRWRCRCPPCR